MHIYREITQVTEDDLFIVRSYPHADFDYPVHMHPEYEISLVLNGKGSRVIGDSVEEYEGDDLVFVGPDIYHGWTNENFDENGQSNAHVLFIQFSKDLFDRQIMSKREMMKIRHLLEYSVRGISFTGEIREKIKARMLALLEMEGFQRVLGFLGILNLLAESADYSFLVSEGFSAKPEYSKSRRINEVYEFIMDNFTSNISLAEVAEIANMSDSAFSHFFKKCTGKSFTQFVIDLRLGYASKLLLETTDNISQICYSSGFNNVSNFNRLFKKYKQMTPIHYRQQFQNQPFDRRQEEFKHVPAQSLRPTATA